MVDFRTTLGSVTALVLTAVVSAPFSGASAEQMSACLRNGKIKQAAVGDQPKKACKVGKETPISWPLGDAVEVPDPPPGPVETLVDCDAGDSLQAAFDAAQGGDTILVSGTCAENVALRRSRVTVDGQETATVDAPESDRSGFLVFGAHNVTLKGLTIQGGGPTLNIFGGAAALIDGNTIQNSASTGVNVSNTSNARMINNLIQNNPSGGVRIRENSHARVGIQSGRDTEAQPNTIQNNGNAENPFADGVRVDRKSSARVVGNLILNNADDGVDVRGVSFADVSDNTIDGHGDNGVEVSENSGVELGSDTGDTIQTRPNKTTAGAESGDFGVRCRGFSYVDGRVGTLNGQDGDRDLSGCINGLAD